MSTSTPLPAASQPDGPRGIAGWLILVAIGQVTGPLYILSGLVQEWSSLPEGTVAAYPAAAFGDFGMRFAYIGLLVYVAILFFNRRAAFPRMFIWTYVAALVLPLAISAWVSATTPVSTLPNLLTSDFLGPYLLSVAVGGVWVAYILNSVRVRNTFEY